MAGKKRLAGWLSAGLGLLLYAGTGGAAMAQICRGHGGVPCAPCCTPNVGGFGYFQPQWREWPGEPRPDPKTIGSTTIPTPAPQPIPAPRREPAAAPAPAANQAPERKPVVPPELPPLSPVLPPAGASPRPPVEKAKPDMPFNLEPVLPVPPPVNDPMPLEERTRPSERLPAEERTAIPPAEKKILPAKPTLAPPGVGGTPERQERRSAVPVSGNSGARHAGPPIIPPRNEGHARSSEPMMGSIDAPPIPEQERIPSRRSAPDWKSHGPVHQVSRLPDVREEQAEVRRAADQGGETGRPRQAAYQDPVSPRNESRRWERSANPPAPPVPGPAMSLEPPAPPVAPPERPVTFPEPPAAPPEPPVTPPSLTQRPLSSRGPAVGSSAPTMDGYCPVELVQNEKWVQGDARWSVVHQGRIYLLSGPRQHQSFLENPARYAPAAGGTDPVAAVEENRHVPGQIEFCVVYDGRLYMFSSNAALTRFQEDPKRYVSLGEGGR